jgi:hypothetical protein
MLVHYGGHRGGQGVNAGRVVDWLVSVVAAFVAPDLKRPGLAVGRERPVRPRLVDGLRSDFENPFWPELMDNV